FLEAEKKLSQAYDEARLAPDSDLRQALALEKLGAVYEAEEKFDRAKEALARASSLFAKIDVSRSQPEDVSLQWQHLGYRLAHLGSVLVSQGDDTGAESSYKQAVEIYESHRAAKTHNPLVLIDLIDAQTGLAQIYLKANQIALAEPLIDNCL